MLSYTREEKTEFGTRLRATRGTRTMSAMAEKYRVSTGHWSKLERGLGSDPSERLVESIARGEGLSYEWLAHGTGPMEEARQPASGPVLDEAVMDVLIEHMYRILNDPILRQAMQTMAEKTGQSELDMLKAILKGNPSTH
jgi:transcriptional regulator with XRE-family HTH domain